MDWLLTDKEIRKVWGYRRGPACGIVDCDRDLIKAQARKIVEKFEEAGIYVIKDGRYLWNPQKFRAFWEDLKKDLGF